MSKVKEIILPEGPMIMLFLKVNLRGGEESYSDIGVINVISGSFNVCYSLDMRRGGEESCSDIGVINVFSGSLNLCVTL